MRLHQRQFHQVHPVREAAKGPRQIYMNSELSNFFWHTVIQAVITTLSHQFDQVHTATEAAKGPQEMV